MEIQQLRYFLAAANHSSFAREAGQCFTSRQNIAHSVNALERELNLPLFERRGNSVVVTPAGQEVAGRVDEILSRVDALQALSVGQVPAEAGLRAAVTYNLLARVPEKVESYLYQFDRGIKLLEVGCEDCYHAICTDEADVGLALCMQRDFPECGFEEVNRLKAYVLVNEMSPLARRSQLSVFDLKDQRIALMSESSFQYEPLFSQLGSLGYDFSNLSIAATSSGLYGIKRNEAVGIATSYFVESLPEGMRAVPFDDTRYDWCIYALYPKRSNRLATIMRFVQGLRKSYLDA